MSRDDDKDGFPDIWEAENGFDPKDSSDAGAVYVSANGEDEDEVDGEDEAGRKPALGTRDRPYKTLAKAADKALRGLSEEARTVVVLGILDWLNANDRNPENQARADSLFVLGKTRYPLTIRGEDLTDSEKPGVLKGYLTPGKRVLYIDSGADITLLNITVTGGKHTGGGIYASGAKLTLGPGTTVTGNESYDAETSACGGIYMERGILVMEKGSSVTGNTAGGIAGVNLVASTLTMKGGMITENSTNENLGGLHATDSTIEMFADAKITKNNGLGVALSYSTLIMHSGSKISGNKTSGGTGGGLYTSGESSVTMEEGSEISENESAVANNRGGNSGGMHVGGMTTFIMKGGKITGNTAGTTGGGINLSGVGTSFTMEGGEISGNTAGTTGGGIYLSGGALLTIKGGTIYGSGDGIPGNKQNTATAGHVTDNEKKGHAIYDARNSNAEPTNHVAYDDNVTAGKFPN
jgi:hypothetical protein